MIWSEQELIFAGTGHRPEELGGYDKIDRLVEYCVYILNFYKPSKVISGMALGFDQALAIAAVEFNIPFIAALPFAGQDSIWPESSKIIFRELLAKAESVHIVCEGGYEPWKMQKRNEWMVDNSDALLALWNGNKEGGTYNCVKYAEKVKRPIYNVWPGWESIQ